MSNDDPFSEQISKPKSRRQRRKRADTQYTIEWAVPPSQEALSAALTVLIDWVQERRNEMARASLQHVKQDANNILFEMASLQLDHARRVTNDSIFERDRQEARLLLVVLVLVHAGLDAWVDAELQRGYGAIWSEIHGLRFLDKFRLRQKLTNERLLGSEDGVWSALEWLHLLHEYHMGRPVEHLLWGLIDKPLHTLYSLPHLLELLAPLQELGIRIPLLPSPERPEPRPPEPAIDVGGGGGEAEEAQPRRV